MSLVVARVESMLATCTVGPTMPLVGRAISSTGPARPSDSVTAYPPVRLSVYATVETSVIGSVTSQRPSATTR